MVRNPKIGKTSFISSAIPAAVAMSFLLSRRLTGQTHHVMLHGMNRGRRGQSCQLSSSAREMTNNIQFRTLAKQRHL
jgi:hypothetical protein